MDMESICFQIITCVGSAKSCYVESIGLAKKGEIEKAREQIAEGDQFFLEGHHVHAELIGQEASGNPVPAEQNSDTPFFIKMENSVPVGAVDVWKPMFPRRH